MNLSKRVFSILSAVLIGVMSQASNASEEEGLFSKFIDYRSSVMTVFAWNLKPMGKMVKGEQPFDAEAFARYARDLASATSVDLLAGFPEDSDAGETDAKPDIWLEWDDFVEKFRNLQRQAMKLSAATSTGNREQIGQEFGATAKTCKACHEKYKE